MLRVVGAMSGRRSGKVTYMINTSVVETHRFGRVKRSGYDPIEVDAVIARLIDELRRTGERIGDLTKRLDTADASAEAILKTFVVAEATRDEIVAEAHAEADAITAAARDDAEAVTRAADELGAEISASRGRLFLDMYQETDRCRRDIEIRLAEHSSSAEWTVHNATIAANRSIAETDARATVAEQEARVEAENLREQIKSMEQAATELESAALSLAEAVQQDAKIIDLTAIEHLDRFGVASFASSRSNGVGRSRSEETLRNTSQHADHNSDIHDLPRTRYQRVTGIPLSERIKIARMSN